VAGIYIRFKRPYFPIRNYTVNLRSHFLPVHIAGSECVGEVQNEVRSQFKKFRGRSIISGTKVPLKSNGSVRCYRSSHPKLRVDYGRYLIHISSRLEFSVGNKYPFKIWGTSSPDIRINCNISGRSKKEKSGPSCQIPFKLTLLFTSKITFLLARPSELMVKDSPEPPSYSYQ